MHRHSKSNFNNTSGKKTQNDLNHHHHDQHHLNHDSYDHSHSENSHNTTTAMHYAKKCEKTMFASTRHSKKTTTSKFNANVSVNADSNASRKQSQPKHRQQSNVVADIYCHLAINNTLSSRLSTISCTLLAAMTATMLLLLLLLAVSNSSVSALECRINADCNNNDKICHESKCICVRDKPVEDNNRCLKLLLIGESCSVSEQCLGNSQCIEGVCSCGDGISIFNPSTQIYYCHPRRNLKESCTHELQCPANAYCSPDWSLCLCLNGYAPVANQCLPKTCNHTSECDTEYHKCEDRKCVCESDHFDIIRGECYRYSSSGSGQSGYGISSTDNIFNSLAATNLWLIIMLLILITLIILALLALLFKRHYRYCWTQSKEYEPHNKAPKLASAFQSGNTINKSFRRKNIDGEYPSPTAQSQSPPQQQSHVDDTRISSPLMSSTSTPV